MRYKSRHSTLNPPVHVVNGWARWLESRGFTGSLREMELAYVRSKGHDSWSEYLLHLGYYGHFADQCQEFWKDIGHRFAEPPTLWHRTVHYLATTRFGVWYIRKYLGMKGRIEA